MDMFISVALSTGISSSPYITSAVSPKRFSGFYYSAPTSPIHRTSNINDTPVTNDDKDFTFDFGGHLERRNVPSADELFDGGMIRAAKLSHHLELGDGPEELTTRKTQIGSQKLPSWKKLFNATFPPRGDEHNRGRERVLSSSPSSTSRRKGTRSLSPARVSKVAWEEDEEQHSPRRLSFFKGYKKWRLKNLLLFRNASEGRASNTPSRKYTVSLNREEDAKKLNFPWTNKVSGTRRNGQVSAYELHYTMNRATSEELRKKTFLPYKNKTGILGLLGVKSDISQTSKGSQFQQTSIFKG